MDLQEKEIAVIGAGVVGLSTALCIQESFPEIKVTIIADKFDDETLSTGAGGLFRPDISFHHDPELVKKWCKESMSHFVKILNSPDGKEAGMQLVSGYHLSYSPSAPENTLVKELVPQFRKLTDEELALFPEKFKSGYFYTTIVTDCRYYLPWMKSKFEKAGGQIVQIHLSSISEIPEKYFVVVNCSGFGGKELMKDKLLVPMRGQTIKVKAPWIKNFYHGEPCYVIPGVDYVTLGGVKDYGCGTTAVNPHQKEFIWEKCLELVPSLKNAEVVWDWVGIRPQRPSVRVDACVVNHNGRYRLVLNNYGHGGHGVTFSHGTACEVTRMLKKVIENNNLPIQAKL